jgi:hypothetical protein
MKQTVRMTKYLKVIQALNRYTRVAEVQPRIPIPFGVVPFFLLTSAIAL